MKKKLLAPIIAVMVLCLPLKAPAEQHTFRAGSLIIPMDQHYQKENDGGLLEAYGLVFHLLQHLGVNGEHDITVYWIVNQAKSAIDGDDLVIEDNTLGVDEHVVKLYDRNQGVLTFPAEFPPGSGTIHDYRPADNKHRVSYRGSVFILDVDGQEAAAVKAIIDSYNWLAVEVHEAQVPFSASVFRKMIGTPPKIALMNDSEDKTAGNAATLESYLRLAGLCIETYEVVTPNEIRDGILRTREYEFLWVPHWHGDGTDGNGNGTPDGEDIVNEIQLFVESGKGVFAQCTSIAELEHYGRFLTNYGLGHNGGTNDPNTIQYPEVTSAHAQIGDFAYKPEGGSLRNFRPYVFGDPTLKTPPPEVTAGNPSIYNGTVSRFAADNTGWDYGVGGYAFGDTHNGYVVYLSGHNYGSCKGSISTIDPQAGMNTLDFDFKLPVDPDPSRMEFEFTKEITNETFTLEVKYNGLSSTSSVTFDAQNLNDHYDQVGDPLQIDLRSARIVGNKLQGVILRNKGGSSISVDVITLSWTGGDNGQKLQKLTDRTPTEQTLYDTFPLMPGIPITTTGFFDVELPSGPQELNILVKYDSGLQTEVIFSAGDLNVTGGNPLEVDLSTARIEGNQLKGVIFRNKGESTITVDSITFDWPGVGGLDLEKLTKIFGDKTDELYDGPEVDPAVELAMTDFTIQSASGGDSAGCSSNDDCSWDNVAGVRYVLNTIFSIKYQLQSNEYVRSAPIVKHPYLYQGSFQYPSYYGHFRKYLVTEQYQAGEEKISLWDAADTGHIANANNNNVDGRKVYSAELGGGSWSKINFDVGSIAQLDVPLSVTPGNGDTSDEEAVITRVRGKQWDRDSSQWIERPNKLGGIMHSAPAIVDQNSRTGSRVEVAYVGDLYGMLHAIDTATGNEKWAFIPSNLLGKLKNDRTDPNASNDFAAVDGSPTVMDVYYDHDNDSNTPNQWRTILVCPEGWGGHYLFALDVTDPDNWSVLWELTIEAVLSYYGTGGFTAGVTLTGQSSGATGQVVYDDTENDELTLKETSGLFQDGETVFEDTDSDGELGTGEYSVMLNQAVVVEMGHAYRASVNKVKWPVRDAQGNIIGYEQKWVVYVATGFLNIATGHGGINVFALDLVTGDKLWHFSDEYLSSVNDIPGAVTLADTSGDNLMDRVYVADMDGRLWELDAVDGTNPNGTVEVGGVTKQMPLWNAGVGKPISVSPAIVRDSGHLVLVFGTGGTDWAANDQAYSVYAVDATQKVMSPTYWDSGTEQGGAGSLLWEFTLPVGEKVWSAPITAAGRIFVATASGTMESANPRKDVAGSGKLYALELADGSQAWSMDDIGRARGSIYVDSQHVYLTTIDNLIRQIGDDTFPTEKANNVILNAWREFW